MSKVLSTKLAVDEIVRFNAAAEQTGESKAGLLKRLVRDYLNGVDLQKEGISSESLLNNEPKVVLNVQTANPTALPPVKNIRPLVSINSTKTLGSSPEGKRFMSKGISNTDGKIRPVFGTIIQWALVACGVIGCLRAISTAKAKS